MKDLTGKKFGRLVVLGKSSKKQNGKIHWWCQCECGNLANTYTGALISGNTKSCGCLQRQRSAEVSTIHGQSKRGGQSKTYSSWASMMSRCYNPKVKHYSYYGGRGLSVCKRWHSFAEFLSDMGEKPEGLSLERTNNNKDYSPENCRWATPSDQSRNARRKGYSWSKQHKRWRARINIDGKNIDLGLFKNEEEAKTAYEEAKANFFKGILPVKALERVVKKDTQGNSIL